ncbi:MAG: hypothetical protein WBM24_06225 [Candidatus Sulfotelmatobacter sp.]
MTGIRIISPADNTCFRIEPGTAATGAQMPVIMAEAGITGVTPDPSSNTRFTWLVKIHFQCSDCGNGLDKEITDEFRLTSTGGKCAIKFPHVRGGDLTITVSADLATGCYEWSSKGLKIRGVNPTRHEINAACGVVALQKICCQESQRRQFDGAAEAGVSDCPLFSGDGRGGVGLMQITNPAPTEDDHWDWRANVSHGAQIFNSKRAAASQYAAIVRDSAAFRQLVQRFNAGRNPPVNVVLPDFTPAQLELDMIRGYNGWAGRDAFGNVLHEFRVPLDAQGNLRIDVDAANRGVIAWEQVPAADRPHGRASWGDPNYVANVQGRIP